MGTFALPSTLALDTPHGIVTFQINDAGTYQPVGDYETVPAEVLSTLDTGLNAGPAKSGTRFLSLLSISPRNVSLLHDHLAPSVFQGARQVSAMTGLEVAVGALGTASPETLDQRSQFMGKWVHLNPLSMMMVMNGMQAIIGEGEGIDKTVVTISGTTTAIEGYLANLDAQLGTQNVEGYEVVLVNSFEQTKTALLHARAQGHGLFSSNVSTPLQLPEDSPFEKLSLYVPGFFRPDNQTDALQMHISVKPGREEEARAILIRMLQGA